MKFSKSFERDYTFYLNNIDNFDFGGTGRFLYQADPLTNDGFTAKECFYKIESGIPFGRTVIDKFKKHIKLVPCTEPELLNALLLCKAGVNFQIKQWAEGIADGTLLLFELSIRFFNEREKLLRLKDCESISFGKNNLVWKNGEPFYYDDIESQYNFPAWVPVAVLNQAKNIIYEKHLNK